MVALDAKTGLSSRFMSSCCPRKRVTKMTEFLVFKPTLTRVSPDENTTTDKMIQIQYKPDMEVDPVYYDEQSTQAIV